MIKYKSHTPNPQRTKNIVNDKKPYIIAVCGGPSSGMSTVAKHIKNLLYSKAAIQSDTVH